jgi:TPP-dependent pyruvate/acetoin dehydrogenase alpha subunit
LHFSGESKAERRNKMKFSKEDKILLYRNLVRGRKYDEELVELFSKVKVPGMWHSGLGQEAVGAGAATFLREGDWLYPSHRGYTFGLARGVDGKRWIADHLGRAGGFSRGKGAHYIAPKGSGILPFGGTIGSAFPISAGAGISAKRLGKSQVVVCLFGDGAAQRGTLHESFNLAGAWKLPIVWVCENNMYSITTNQSSVMAVDDIAKLAGGYDMPGVVVDGQDVIAVADAVMEGVERARAGKGPSLVECKTYRYRNHGEGDAFPTNYRTKEEEEEWKRRDPIKIFHQRLLDEGVATEDELDTIDAEIADEVAEASKWAQESPWPKVEVAFSNLFAE